MPKKKTPNLIQEVIDFSNEKKGLLFIVGNPEKDELIVSFSGKVVMVKFPISFDNTNNVMVRMMHGSTFAQGMSDFISGLTKGIELDAKSPPVKVFMNAIGGAMQSMVDYKDKILEKNGKK